MEQGRAENSPLDQLEAQVNIVLEHTGRLFANNARNHGAINNPLRLKQVIVGATDSFHDALDELEVELALARAVLRRDLAVYRAKRGTRPKPDQVESPIKDVSLDVSDGVGQPDVAIKDEDIVMDDFIEEKHPSPLKEQVPSPTKIEEGVSDAKPEETSPLQIDIPGQDHQAPGHSTDAATGTYSNFDFESLFNDPSSAGGASRGSPKLPPAEAEPSTTEAPTSKPTEPAPQKPDHNGTNPDFDFSDLTNFGRDTDMQDTDGISSLLPGLESYANSGDTSDPQPGAETEFNIFDAAGATDFGTEASKPAAQEHQQQQGAPDLNMDNRDDTFDDIMNFTNFDLGDFGNEGAENEEHKFDASFFDI